MAGTNTRPKGQHTSGVMEMKKKRTATLLDLDVIDCPVCFETLTIPIFQCDNGHIACSTCLKKLRQRCATCSFPTISRNRAMERILELLRVPCPNSELGCSEDVSYHEISEHLEQCAFTPCSCPFKNCNFTGSYINLYKHSVAKHRESLGMFKCGKPVYLCFGSCKRIVLKEESKEGGELVVIERFRTPHGAAISVSCIAPKVVGTGEFSYILTSRSRPADRFYSDVKRVHEVSCEPPGKHFMLLPAYMRSHKKMTIRIKWKVY